MVFEIFSPNIDRYIFAIVLFFVVLSSRVILRKFAYKLVEKTSNKYDDEIVYAIRKPVDFFFLMVAFNVAKSMLVLVDDLNILLDHIIRSGFIFSFFWGFILIITTLSQHIHQVKNKFGDKISIDVANFIVKTVRVILIMIGFVAILQEWGYNVSAFLASLGLVGMAFALAAKDTAANLFGSLVIFSDKPFKVGDWIKTPDVEGTIMYVGIRSTTVRTFAQAVVTVPNASLANSPILNWSRMGKRRIKMNLGLTYGTTAEQIENIVADIKEMLENHNDIHQETMYIYFTSFGDSSLNIFCYFFTKTTSWGVYMSVKENINLKLMKIIEKNGSAFAYPSQSLYIESNTKNQIEENKEMM